MPARAWRQRISIRARPLRSISVVRTTMSASWVFIPVAVAIVLETSGLGVMNVWAVMALLFALCLALVFIFLPETARGVHAPAGLPVSSPR